MGRFVAKIPLALADKYVQYIDQINQQLKQTPLIYVCVELERALGLEDLLENYHVICYQDSQIVDQLLEKGVDVHLCSPKWSTGWYP